jgi:protein-tyrosine phosphatase
MMRARAIHMGRLTVLLLGLSGWPVHGRQPPSSAAAGIPFESADVSGDGHAFLVSWHGMGIEHVRILAGTDPEHIGTDRPVGDGGVSGEATVSQLPIAPRWYFQLLPDHGTPLVIADRSLHLTTAANFRDAGGYRTQQGKWVRMGLVYRSNGLEHLTDDELAEIERLHIKLVCDLRTREEVQRSPDRVPEGAADVPADVLADDADLLHAILTGGTLPPGAPPKDGLEERIYRDFVRLPSAQEAYRALFERLADPAQLPTVFHCTAGKDRTGWAQAVFLTILGVPHATIVADYALTNEYLQGEALNSVRKSVNGGAASGLRANPAALEAAFDQVNQQYGSFDRYLREGLRLSDATLAALRRNFLAG